MAFIDHPQIPNFQRAYRGHSALVLGGVERRLSGLRDRLALLPGPGERSFGLATRARRVSRESEYDECL